MLGFIGDWIKEEAQLHPRAAVVVVLLAVFTIGYSYRVFAQQVYVDSRFGQLEDRIGGLELTVEQRHFEGQLHVVEGEIWAIERIITQGEDTERDHTRLTLLRNALGDIQRKLIALENKAKPK